MSNHLGLSGAQKTVVESSAIQRRRALAVAAIMAVLVGVLSLAAPVQASPQPVDNSASVQAAATGGFSPAQCNGNAALRPAVIGTVRATTGATTSIPVGGSLVVVEQQAGDRFVFAGCAFTNAQGEFALNVTASAVYLITIDGPTTSGRAGVSRAIMPGAIPQGGLTGGTAFDLGPSYLPTPINLKGTVNAPLDDQGTVGPIPDLGAPEVPVVIVCLESTAGGMQLPLSCSLVRRRGSDPVATFALATTGAMSLAGYKVYATAYGPDGPIGYGEMPFTGSESPSMLQQLVISLAGPPGGGGGGGGGQDQGFDLSQCNVNASLRPAIVGTVAATVSSSSVPQAGALVLAERIGDSGNAELAGCAFADAQGRFALDVATAGFYDVYIDGPTTSGRAGALRFVDPDRFPSASLTGGQAVDLGTIDLLPTNVSGQLQVDFGSGPMTVTDIGSPGYPHITVCLKVAVPGQGGAYPASCSLIRSSRNGLPSGPRFALGIQLPFNGVTSLAGATVSARAGAGGSMGYGEVVLTGSESATDLMNLVIPMSIGGGDNGGGGNGGGGPQVWNGCSQGETPDLTGTVTAGGNPYPTTVSVLVSGSPISDPSQRYRGDVSQLFTFPTESNGTYQFCTFSQLSQHYPWAQTLVVQAATVDNTYGTTTGTWRESFSCDVQDPCIENIAMRTRMLAGVAQLPPGELTNPGDMLRFSLRNSGMNSLYVDAQVSYDLSSQNRSFSFSRLPNGSSLAPGDYELVVQPEGGNTLLIEETFTLSVGDGGVITPGPRFGPTSTPTNLVATLSAANITGDVVQENGSPLGQNQWLQQITVIRDGEGCSLDNFYDLPASCLAPSGYWGYEGQRWKAKLGDGAWVVRAEVDGLATTGRFTVSNNGTTISSSDPNLTVRSQTLGSEPMLRLKLSSGNFRGLPVRPSANTVSVSGLSVQVSKWNGNYFSGVPGNIRDESGEVVMNITETGVYQFTFGPRMNYQGQTDASAPADVASTTHTVKIEVTGATATITESCTLAYESGPPTPVCTPVQWPTVASGASQGAYRFDLDVANLQIRVCAPAQGANTCPPVQNVWLELLQSNGQWFNYNRGLNPADGWARLRLTNDGPDPVVYQFKVRPPYGNPDLWTTPTVTFQVGPGASPVVSVCAGNDTNCDQSTVLTPVDGVVTLPPLQFAASTMFATVMVPGNASTPVSRAYVQVMRDQDGFMEHLGGGESNDQGRVALDGIVTQPGNYRLEAQPPWDSTAGFTSTTKTFSVTQSANGTLALHVDNAPLVVRLGQPNVTGRVMAGTRPVAFANINVEQWSDEEQQWRWANRWTNADNNGTYRLTLPAGRWRLNSDPQPQYSAQYSTGRLVVDIVDPSISLTNQNIEYQAPNLKIRVTGGVGGPGIRWANVWLQRYDTQLGYFVGGESGGITDTNGYTALNLTTSGVYRVEVMPQPSSGLTRVSTFVSVSAGTPTRVCQVASIETANTCNPSGYLDGDSNPLLVALAGPNLRGWISAGGATVSGWVNLDRYNAASGRYEWGELWADSNGRDGFSLKLEPGSYRLMASPRTSGQYSRTTVFVTVSASATEWCRFATDPASNPAQSPAACSGTTPRLEVALTGANVVGGVTNGITGTSVSATWVNVEQWDVIGNYWRWVDVHGDVQNGRFALTLEPSQTPYRLTVHPPFGNSGGVTRIRRAMWVMDDNSVCVASAAESGGNRPADCSGGTAFAPGATQSFVMTGGNVTGTVSYPNGGGFARDAEISVEVLEGTFWQWTENWTRTGANGAFSVNLTSNGTYRITARPPWGASGQFSPVTTTITVAGCDSSCSTHSPSMVLASPNVTITLQNPASHANPSATVPDAWIHVERKVGDRWEWTFNGGNTNRSGSVAFNLEQGEYRLWVNPPWNRSDLARFSTTIVVASSAINETVRFPSPNLSVPVLDPSGQRLPNVWAFAQRWNNNFYEWADIFGSANQSGVLTMSLSADGQYRVVVEPPPGRADLSRFAVDVTVSGGVVTPPIAQIQFPTANVTGTVRLSDGGAVARFGWVEIRQDGNYIDGTPVRENGTFSSRLADGVYELVIHPNYSQTQQSPVRLDVTVSGSSTTWAYQGDSGSSSSGPVNVHFGRMQRNVSVTVTGTPVVGAGAFVTFRDTASGETFNFVTNESGVAEGIVPHGRTYDISAVVVEGSVVRAATLASRVVNTPAAPTVASPDTFTVAVAAVS